MEPTNSTQCPACGARFRVKAEHVGRPGRCAKCGHVFPIACDDVYSLAPLTSDEGRQSTSAESPGTPSAPTKDDIPHVGGKSGQGVPTNADSAGDEYLNIAPRQRCCGHCGATISPDAVVCVNCGFDRRTDQSHGGVRSSPDDLIATTVSDTPPAGWPGATKPALVWLIAILVPLALVWRGSSAWQAYGSREHIIAFLCLLVLLSWLAICVGLKRRSALAYRMGLILLPCGAGLIWLIAMLSYQATGVLSGWSATLAVLVIAVLLPVFWIQPGAKRYFGLSCPRCGSLAIGARDLLFAQRLCRACGAIFDESGAVQQVRGDLRRATSRSPRVGVANAEHSPGQSRFQERAEVQPRELRDFSVVAKLILLVSLVALPVSWLLRAATKEKVRVPDGLLAIFWGCHGMVLCLALLLAVGVVFWVYRTHREIRQYTRGAYPISAGVALGLCFVPVFNAFWLPYIMYRLARYVRGNLRYAGLHPSPGLVVTLEITCMALAIVSFFIPLYVPAVGPLLHVYAMKSVQEGLNALWTETPRTAPAVPELAFR